MIDAERVVKTFDGVRALDNLSMHVKKGSIYGLVGPNGAGKTTIINHITGALRPDKGKILINGQSVYEDSVRSSVLSIADDWFYYATFTIKEMAAFYRSVYKRFNDERYRALKNIFGIDEKKQIRRLSKGMKKQAAFWLALSCMPETLILDEPLDGLDPVMRRQVLKLIIGDVSDRGMTTLVSSHNLRELEDVCDYVGIIHRGKMIIEKPLDDLKGSVHKYQVVFKEAIPKELEENENVLHSTKLGSVYTLIIKGDAESVKREIEKYAPLVCDVVGLTLEEVFIYELGGLGYDFEGILV